MVHALVNMFGEDCILNESWPEPHHGSTLQEVQEYEEEAAVPGQ